MEYIARVTNALENNGKLAETIPGLRTAWIPSHDKKLDSWKPPEGHDDKLWRKLNDDADLQVTKYRTTKAKRDIGLIQAWENARTRATAAMKRLSIGASNFAVDYPELYKGRYVGYKRAVGRKLKKARYEVEEYEVISDTSEEDDGDDDDDDAPPPPAAGTKKQRRQKTDHNATYDHISSSDDEKPRSKITIRKDTKDTKKGRSKGPDTKTAKTTRPLAPKGAPKANVSTKIKHAASNTHDSGGGGSRRGKRRK